MIKLLLGLAIVLFCGFFGYFLSKKYRKRKEFFLQLSQFNDRFLAEISYYKRPLSKFLTANAYKGEFDVLLRDYYQTLKEESAGGRRIFTIGKEELPFLTADELSFVQDYFCTLGKGDTASQKDYFSAAKAWLLESRQKSEAECKKYGDLYVKLGILVGLAALILIV